MNIMNKMNIVLCFVLLQKLQHATTPARPNPQFWVHYLRSTFYSWCVNCPILGGARLHNGSVQAFLTRMAWKERKAECSLPLSVCLSPPSLLSAPCISCRVVLVDRRFVSKSSSSYLAPPHTHTLLCKGHCECLSLPLRPQLEPMYHTASHHNTVE